MGGTTGISDGTSGKMHMGDISNVHGGSTGITSGSSHMTSSHMTGGSGCV